MKTILCATVLLLFCTSKASAATESADPWTSQWKAPDLNEFNFRHWINFVRPINRQVDLQMLTEISQWDINFFGFLFNQDRAGNSDNIFQFSALDKRSNLSDGEDSRASRT